MKEFIFDRLVDRDNICDLEKEKEQIQRLIDDKKNIIVYAQRNFGKTSLVKNVIIEDFRRKHKKNFVFFADLMSVKDMDSICLRLKSALENSVQESLPAKSIFDNIKGFFKNLRPVAYVDNMTQDVKFSLESTNAHTKNIQIADIFESIAQIGEEYPSLIVIDEFQDVALIDEAESLFRNSFQQITNIPIIILGSKKHLLKDIFALPRSPLANFGQDVVINPIDYEKYHEYILERFASKKLTMNKENSTYLQDLMQRQPEAINILCYEIFHNNNDLEVDKTVINKAIQSILEQRNKRFEVLISSLSIAKEKILIAIAKNDNFEKLQTKEFTSLVDLTPRSVKSNVSDLMNQGLVDVEDNKYYVCDPLLKMYLKVFR